MQINQSKFSLNGGCGYILRPDFMFRDDFDPYDHHTLVGVDPMNISIRVIGARHLTRTGRGTTSPFVEVEIIGAEFDSGIKLTTKTICKKARLPKLEIKTCQSIVSIISLLPPR